MAAFFVIQAAQPTQPAQSQLPKPRVFRDRTMQLDLLDDHDLMARYRLPRHCLLELFDTLKPTLERPTNRNHALPVSTQVLAALRFFATGTMQKDAGDLHGISQASVSRCISNVSAAICSLASEHIVFPRGSDAEKQTMAGFHDIAHFPSVLGCVDGTQIAIISPRQHENIYVCRKGYHSINVQVICDADLKWLNVVAKWPGSSHDSYIFRTSSVLDHLERRQQQQQTGWLLGDSGYPLLTYLMTPVLRPAGTADERYNKAQRATRNTVERAIGVWKMRFRCLHKTGGCLQSPPETCSKIIMACAVLHNICIDNRLPQEEDSADDSDDDDMSTQPSMQQSNGAKSRARLIQQRFAREN